MSTERANHDFVQSAAPMGTTTIMSLAGISTFSQLRNMKMTALSVTPGAACFDKPMTDFPCKVNSKSKGKE
jgi:hypothetical protein